MDVRDWPIHLSGASPAVQAEITCTVLHAPDTGERTAPQQTDRPHYGEMCSDRRTRLHCKCKKRFRLKNLVTVG